MSFARQIERTIRAGERRQREAAEAHRRTMQTERRYDGVALAAALTAVAYVLHACPGALDCFR